MKKYTIELEEPWADELGETLEVVRKALVRSKKSTARKGRCAAMLAVIFMQLTEQGWLEDYDKRRSS